MSSKEDKKILRQSISDDDGIDWSKHLSVLDDDFIGPCPSLANKCPRFIVISCCCFWSELDRKQCSLGILYSKLYYVMYLLIIVLTLIVFIYEVASGGIHNNNTLSSEELWIIFMDIICIILMIIDLIIQIQAYYDIYFKSILNVIDFSVVFLCVITIPFYFTLIPDYVLTVILIIRVIVRLIRLGLLYKHHRMRKEYINARDSIVDFGKFKHNNNEANIDDDWDDLNAITNTQNNVKNMGPKTQHNNDSYQKL